MPVVPVPAVQRYARGTLVGSCAQLCPVMAASQCLSHRRAGLVVNLTDLRFQSILYSEALLIFHLQGSLLPSVVPAIPDLPPCGLGMYICIQPKAMMLLWEMVTQY